MSLGSNSLNSGAPAFMSPGWSYIAAATFATTSSDTLAPAKMT